MLAREGVTIWQCRIRDRAVAPCLPLSWQGGREWSWQCERACRPPEERDREKNGCGRIGQYLSGTHRCWGQGGWMSAFWLCATGTARKKGRRTCNIKTNMHTQMQAELTFMDISDHLVAELSEFRLSNITCTSDLHRHNHIHHSNGSFRTTKQ